MSVRKVNRRPLRKVAIGDMREPVEILHRSTRPSTSRTTHEVRRVVTNTLYTSWASIVSINGFDDFNSVNIEESPTHKITMRYEQLADIDHDILIRDSSNIAYQVLHYENFENRNEYWVFLVKRLGDYDKAVNK